MVFILIRDTISRPPQCLRECCVNRTRRLNACIRILCVHAYNTFNSKTVTMVRLRYAFLPEKKNVFTTFALCNNNSRGTCKNVKIYNKTAPRLLCVNINCLHRVEPNEYYDYLLRINIIELLKKIFFCLQLKNSRIIAFVERRNNS